MFARPRRAALVLFGVAVTAATTAAPTVGEQRGAAGVLEIRLGVEPSQIAIGRTVTVSGRAFYREAEGPKEAGPAGGLALTLNSGPSPYPTPPYGEATMLGQTVTAADGSFSFTEIEPSRNTYYYATISASSTSPEASPQVWVDPLVKLAARSLGPGRTRLSVHLVHTPEAHPGATKVRWYVAPKGGRFTPVAVTPLRDLADGTGDASAVVAPPARRFLWKVCLNPRWEKEMGPPPARGPCPDHAFRVPAPTAARAGVPAARAAFMFGGEASGTPAPPFPSQSAVAAAERWLNARAGATALAVIDSSGRLSGIRMRSHFETASVIKVMFLAAYLKRLEAAHRRLGAADRALLYPMIHESNNDAASSVLGVVGEPAVERVARAAGMRDYAPGVGWWAFSQTSAADQAQLLWRLGEVMPRRFYPYARYLMSTIEPEQSWGFPPVARPDWQVYFKTGALPSRGLFNEVARLERGGVAFSVAVLSDHDPSQAYGEETIAGVARALLAGG